jgi:SagB-type dehydrogenase family enzyme
VSTAARRQTARWLEFIYGQAPPLDDPAETYHEASKVSPTQIGRQIEGARRLDASPDLQISSTRAVKRRAGSAAALPPARIPACTLWDAIGRRRSQRSFAEEAIDAAELSALLEAAYGVTGVLESTDGPIPLSLRAVPSGGALYPLELYVAALRSDGLEPALYHFDPLRRGLEIVRPGVDADEVSALSTYPQIVGGCGALILIAAIFGRTRFKYGLRSYRFALLEAGHVAQNIVLTATALGLAAVPLGGFYDRRTDEFLGLDGVNESALYTIAVGREPG